METQELKLFIKESFCNLTKFKLRGDIVEVITPFSTINNKFVSVFIKIDKGWIVVTDGGWVDSNLYDYYIFEESEEILKKVVNQYISSYNIKLTSDHSGKVYYYKKTNSAKEITTLVHDLAQFTVGVVNSYTLQYKDPKEETQRETFRKDANSFLKMNYKQSINFKYALDDLKNIKHNAVIRKDAELYIINYVTGSSSYYFENDLRKSIVNFEISEKSKYNEHIRQKVSIINDYSEGYNPSKSSSILTLLREKTTAEPILWSEKERLLQLINV